MTEREMGLLSQLALRQEEYRGLLRDILEDDPDASFIDASNKSSVKELDEDRIIAAATVKFEMEDFSEVSKDELLWAAELIDHLDTIGWKLERK